MKTTTLITLAWEHFCQQYRTSDSRLLRWTQLCLIFFLLTLNLTSHSIQQYLDDNLQQLLGADVVISQFTPLNQTQLDQVNQLNNGMSVVQQLNVTLTNKQIWQNMQLKVVDDNYPLQGQLKTSVLTNSVSETTTSGPKPGFIWLGPRAFSTLDLTIGQTINMAEHNFIVERILHHEPDRLMEGHNVAMRAMIHKKDYLKIKKQSQEKINYRYLLSADLSQSAHIISWAKTNLPTAQVLHRQGGHPLALFWQRTENFLGLTSVLLFLMAAIAIDQAGRRQLLKQKHYIALCMSMGINQQQGILFSFINWIINFLLLLIPSFFAAFLAQEFIVSQLQQEFTGIASQINYAELIKMVAILFLLLISFQIPNWIEISKTTVAQLIRQQQHTSMKFHRVFWSLLSITILAFVYSDNLLLTGLTMGIMAASTLILALLTWLTLTLGEKLSIGKTGLLAFSFFMMKNRLLSKSAQILGVGLCTTLLLFTLSLMKDIGVTMGKYTRSHDGNLIIAQAQEEQLIPLQNWSKQTNSEIRQLKAFSYGQLIAINDKSLTEHSDKPSDSAATLAKPIRLHSTQELPVNNQVISGKWWHDTDQNWQQISAEQEIITDMGLNIGDKLSFDINSKRFDFILKASHEFVPGKGTVTFWFQIPQSAVDIIQAPRFYMGSMELPDSAWPKLSQLWQQHPSLRLTPVKEMTERFDDMLAILIKLVSAFSAMISLLALLVIMASVQGYEADEKLKNALLLSFGQSKLTCLKLSIMEWLTTALIASVGAILGTWLAGSLIYSSQFGMQYTPDIIWTISSLFVVIIIVCSAGLITSRHSLRTSIKQLLA